MNRSLFILLALVLCGCSHVARHYTAPDSGPMQAKHAEVVTYASTARQHAAKAREAHTRGIAFHKAEGEIIAQAETTLAKPEFQNAPPDLQPLIAELRGELDSLKLAHEATAKANAEETPEIAGAELSAAKAETAAKEITDKYGPAYTDAVDKLAVHANEAEQGWHHDSAQIVWIVGHSILVWIVGIVVVVGIVALAVLKFGAQIAAVFK